MAGFWTGEGLKAFLSARGLTASYGGPDALHGVDLDLGRGESVALLGANGAGKTTFLRAVCGMVHAGGALDLDGKSLIGAPTEDIARLGVAHAPEGGGLFARMSVAENMLIGAITRRDRRAVAQDLEQNYARFPALFARRKQPAGVLSGGERQMLALARALMMRPRAILLDEPSFGLAPLMARAIFDMLAQIKSERNVSMLLVEQNAALALELADRAYVLQSGTIIRAASAADFTADEKLRRAYLGY